MKMNDDKTGLIAIGTKSKISQVTPILTPVSIFGYDIPTSQSVENHGFHLDETLSIGAHIKHLCLVLFCQLKNPQLMLPTNSLFVSYSQD